MSKKKKFYTVWNGVQPGVYDNWNECKLQIDSYPDAVYKSFESLDDAKAAFNDSPWNYIKTNVKCNANLSQNKDYIFDSLAVDAACSGNPGTMEYRGVTVADGKEIFKQGPFAMGTNNVGEFLALVHGLALLKQKNSLMPIYSDSVNAIKWVKAKKCKTKLAQTSENKAIFNLIERAEKWLQNNTYTTQIYKWETKCWGEIPADFGRK